MGIELNLKRLRRVFSLCGVGAVLFTAGCSQAPEPAQQSKPNIVFVLADDQGWADMGYNGSEIRTPNLDELARTGVRLDQHYVHPVCSPTRAALVTGRYPSRFGILGPISGDSKQQLPMDVATVPRVLSSQGYVSHLSGKWHLALSADRGPTKYGFNTSYGYLHGQIDPYTHRYKFGDATWHRNEVLFEEEGHATDLITAEAVRFIEEQGEQPFFLYVAYSVPHFPLAEPDDWTVAYQDQIQELSRRVFAASVSHMDDGVGKIVAALDRKGIRETTLIVYSSDNGGQESWMDTEGQYEGRYPPAPVLGNNLPLRGWKGEVYEGGIRVPAFANWPGTLSPRVVSEPVHMVDWLPTFARLAGASGALPTNLDGQDIWDLVNAGTISEGQANRTIYVKAGSGSSLRRGEWKLVWTKGGERELFNLADDPEEKVDLAGEQPDLVEELTKVLESEQAKDGEATFTAKSE